MIDFIREYQMNIMIILSSVCAIIAFFVCITTTLPRKRRIILLLTELYSVLLLIADRYAYIYRGNPSETGYWMVRICNCIVFIMILGTIRIFGHYLADIILNEGKRKKFPTGIGAVNIIVTIGEILVIVSQFTGLYYTFDESNNYERSNLFFVCYFIPVVCFFILLYEVFKYFKSFKVGIRFSLFMFTVMPLFASLLQLGNYGVSFLNMTIAAVAILLYIFALMDMNKSIERANELEMEYLREEQERMQHLFKQTAMALVNAIDAKDNYTHGHSSRVAEYSRKIAEMCGKSEQECEEIYYAALLHDVGKIGIPDRIINKEGKLTEEEYAEMKKHPVIGAQILSSIGEYPYISIGAKHHHERYDGKGYPDGLKGEDIPEIGRIVAVADAYDAMTSKRSYREAIPQQKVREEIVKGSGTQFDPKFAKIMQHLIDLDLDYEMKDKGDAGEMSGKNEIISKEMMDDYSEGVLINPCKTLVTLRVSAADKNSDKPPKPRLVLFDSLDGRIHKTEQKRKDLNYFEYAYLDLDGSSKLLGARDMKIEKTVEMEEAGSRRLITTVYEITAVKIKDHARVIIKDGRETIDAIIALPDSSRYLYIGVTGENCLITDMSGTRSEKESDASSIPRIAEEISYINVPEGDIPNIQIDGYRTEETAGIQLKGEMVVSFHTMSLPTARLVWHCPFVSLFYSDNGLVNGPNFREVALIRIDGENWEADDLTDNKMIMYRTEKFEGWDEWKAKNKEGFDCEVHFKFEGDTITTTTENAGISVRNVTIMRETPPKIYFALTGDQCALTNIRIRSIDQESE